MIGFVAEEVLFMSKIVVGRPNVGKVHLVQQTVRTKISIVDDTPGVTETEFTVNANGSRKSFCLFVEAE